MLWVERENNYTEDQRFIIKKISDKYSTDEFISGLIAERNNYDLKEVDYFLSDTFKPVSPFGLKNMKEAVSLVFNHMNEKNLIMVNSDFDADGLHAAYGAKNIFDAFGYTQYYINIPHRQKESYGLSVKIVERAHSMGVKLIITADNGISAFAAIDRANELGIDVLVTDHHEVIMTNDGVAKLPNATVIVNPHLLDCTYPYKMLSGGGVIYKLGQALIMSAPESVRNRFITEGYKERLICSAALSAIADVMKITGENRALVKEAFKYLDAGVIPAVNLFMPKASVYAVSFTYSPRLSSVARLSDMNKSFEFLCEENPEKLLLLKEEIESFNDRRKELQEKGLEVVKKKLAKTEGTPKIIVDIVDGLPETLIGLISGKIKEEFKVPTIIFSKTNKGDYKGSGRSIDAYDMFGEISPFLTPSNGVEGGGHPMACGLRGKTEEDIYRMREFLLGKCTLTDEDLTPKIRVDKYLSIRDDLVNIHDSVKLLEPFGVGNPSPTFAFKHIVLDIEFKKYRNGEFAKFIISDDINDDFVIDGICWDESIYLKEGRKFFDLAKADIIADIEINSYTKKPQLNIKAIRYYD